MAVIGGLGSLWGGIVGAVVITVLIQALNAVSNQPGLPPDTGTILQYGAYAVLLIVALLFIPRGIVPTLTDVFRRRARGTSSRSRAGAGGRADRDSVSA